MHTQLPERNILSYLSLCFSRAWDLQAYPQLCSEPAKYTCLVCPCVCSAVCKLGSIKRLYRKKRSERKGR